ncbi:DNA helicase rad5 [Entophlyctis sp. JEL0112]|nr:DNA helicase rad5 [Entophlyctis sp. JEL0112]
MGVDFTALGSSSANPPAARRTLSRSISFSVADDKSLGADADSVKKRDPPSETSNIQIGTFSGHPLDVSEFHRFFGQPPKRVLLTRQVVKYRRSSVTSYKMTLDQDSAVRQTLSPIPESMWDAAVNSNCEFWFSAEGELHSATARLEVRWPKKSIASLRSEAALNDSFVTRFWANQGVPFEYKDGDFMWSHGDDGLIDVKLTDMKVPATFDIVPCDQPEPPFALALYDYQLRTLAWMQGIEDGERALYYVPNVIDLSGNTDFADGIDAIDMSSGNFLTKIDDDEYKGGWRWKEHTVRSGIIADKPGVGKTITTLALCHSRPFVEDAKTPFLFSLHPGNSRFISKATALIVPNNIADQWEQEIRKCLGSTVRVIQVKGKGDYHTLTLQDILESDYVIISYQFLVNGAYKGSKSHGRYLANYGKKFDFSVEADRKTFASTRKGDFAFTWIHFHRVVCDEFHEVTDKSAGIRDQVREMSGTYIWGLTGTPRFESPAVVAQFAAFLGVDTAIVPECEAFRFIQNRVRRNEPEVSFPPPIHEVVAVKQSAVESAFYRSCTSNLSVVDLLKLCNHYQIGNAAASLGMYNAMSIEQVTNLVQSNRQTQIMDLLNQIENAQGAILEVEEEREGEIAKADRRTEKGREKLQNKLVSFKNRIDALEASIIRYRETLAPIQAQYNYFQNFMNSYLAADGSKVECNVCLDDDVVGDIGIVPCGHAFCWDCANEAVQAHGRCPNCREAIQVGEIMKVLPPKAMKEAEGEIDGLDETREGDEKLDPNMFGSKIREMVKYLKSEMKESEKHRFIVFIQFADLADLVSAALNTYGITTARLKKGWQERERALRMFRAGLANETETDLDDIRLQNEETPADSSNRGLGHSNQEFGFDDPDSTDKGKRKAELIINPRPAKVSKRDNRKFQKPEKPVKVLMLSARDSVSGLNLTEASHCIVLHPFHSDIDEYAIASEKQGIARVLRNGQRKVVKIVRFYVENTIEARIHEERMRVHGKYGLLDN